MKRSEFITLLGGAAAWPFAAGAQQAMPVIGWLSSRTSETDALVLPAFRQGLNAQGYVEGRNVAVEYRWANAQDDRLPALAADLVRRPVAVIVAVGNSVPWTRAAKAANTTIPIVLIIGGDPVKLGLVANLNRPGGNITGVTTFMQILGPKRLGLLHELLPRATTIAVLVNPSLPGSTSEAADLQEPARALGLQIKIFSATTERDLDAAFASLAQMRADALVVMTGPFFFTHSDQIVASAARLALPTLYFRREFAAAGGLMSYGSNADDTYRVLGDYAGRILKGEKPRDLPVQQPTKFEMVLNLKTAKALRLEMPDNLLALADEVIE